MSSQEKLILINRLSWDICCAWIARLAHSCHASQPVCCCWFFYCLFSGKWGNLLRYYIWVWVLSKGGRGAVKLGLPLPRQAPVSLREDDTTEGAFQRRRHIQLADTRRAKEVKLLRLAQPIVLIIIWRRFPLLPCITRHALYSTCHSCQTSKPRQCVSSRCIQVSVFVSVCLRLRGPLVLFICAAFFL